MPHIEVRNVVKVFPMGLADSLTDFARIILDVPLHGRMTRTRTAVNGVTLEIGSGERVGIIGPNGAGKSTLLHLISGIASLTSGSISVEGHVTSVMTLGVGLREDLTGRENVYVDGELQGKSRREVDLTIEEIVAFTELGEFIDRPIRTYSTGMKARLAFAMIAFLDPEILIIDEALSVGDLAFAKKASQRIREICARGQIVIVVSHGLETIQKICTRCIWMEDGRIRMDGSPLDVIEAYQKSVRERQEREHMTQYHRHMEQQSFEPGWAVNNLQCCLDGAVRVGSLPIGGNFSLRWCACLPSGIHQFDIQLVIERLDGLTIVNERMRYEGSQFASETIEQEVEIPPILSHGVYRVQVSIVRLDRELAYQSLVLEVIDPNPPSGGRPALVAPYSILVA